MTVAVDSGATISSTLDQVTAVVRATPFNLKSGMEASALVDNDYAVVTDDPTIANNGFYQKQAGVWGYLAWNPLNQAKAYADANPMFRPVVLTAAADFNTLIVEGRTVVPTNAIAAACTNRPPSIAGVLDVALVGSGVLQVYRVFEFDLAYERQRLSNATWTDWVQSASKDMVDTTAANTLQSARDYTDNELSVIYQARSVIVSDTSLNSYVSDGDYYGASGLTLLDAPSDFDNTSAFIFTARTITDNNRFAQQSIFLIGSKYGKRWDRFLDKNDMSGAWVAVNYLADASVTAPKIADLAVNNAKLSADNQYVATLTSVSLNAALKQGLYIVVTCTNAPSGLSSGLMRVDSYNGGSYQVQTIVDLTDASKCYSRTTRPNQSTPVYNAWADVKGGADAVNGSRLTDKTVTNAKLSDYYAYNSSVSTGSFNDLYRQGSYVIAGVLADAPSGGPASGLLIVDALNGGSYVIQRLHQINKPERVWTRQIRPASGTPSFGAWLYMGLDQIKTHAQYFADKRMVCFGDSVTEFGDYPARLAARLGLAEAVNVGFGGCRMAVHESVKYDAMSMYRVAQAIASQNFTNLELRAQQLYDEDGDDNRAIVARLKAVNFANVNYITIFYGQNDFAADIPIGVPSDNTGATFWGAINISLNAILTAYPHIKITLVAPYWRARRSSGDGLESDANPNSIGKYLIEYVDALIAAGIKYKLPVVDMYRSSGINSYTAATYLTDGLHPTLPAGYQLIADKLAINF